MNFGTIWHYATEIVTIASAAAAILPPDIANIPIIKWLDTAVDFLALNVFNAKK